MTSFVTARGVLTPHQRGRITRGVKRLQFLPGMVTAGGVPSDIRANSLTWLPRPDWQWLYDLVRAAAEEANAGLWRVDVSEPLGDDLQYTRYEAGEGYGWHRDSDPTSPGQIAWRTLSIIVPLNDAAEGGGVELRGVGEVDLRPGDAVVFPADTEHRALPVETGTRNVLVLWLSRSRPPAIVDFGTYPPIPVVRRTERSHLYHLEEGEAVAGLTKLVADGLRLPYGMMPGAFPGGTHAAFMMSWRRWRDYARLGWWNPPGGLRHLPEFAVADPDASPMPSWTALYEAAKASYLADARDIADAALRDAFRRRVEAALADPDLDRDAFFRRRDAARERYTAAKAALERLAPAELAAFNVDDALDGGLPLAGPPSTAP